MMYNSSSTAFLDKYIVIVSILFLGLIVYRLSFIDNYIHNDTEFDQISAMKGDLQNRNDILSQQIARNKSYSNVIAIAVDGNYISADLELNLEKFVSNNSIAFNEQ